LSAALIDQRTRLSPTMVGGMDVRLATKQDVPAVMALESRYYVGNLDQVEQAEGFASILQPREWFDRAVDTNGLHIAVDGQGAAAGFIAMTEPPTLNAVTAQAYRDRFDLGVLRFRRQSSGSPHDDDQARRRVVGDFRGRW